LPKEAKRTGFCKTSLQTPNAKPCYGVKLYLREELAKFSVVSKFATTAEDGIILSSSRQGLLDSSKGGKQNR